MGYSLAEIQGKHHKMFLNPKDRLSQSYQHFWQDLATGQEKQGEFSRQKKDGSIIWLQASYTPIFNSAGVVQSVIKFASDITAQKIKDINSASIFNAIDRSQAVIEFDLSGHILSANENFLSVMGYTLENILGKHHMLPMR